MSLVRNTILVTAALTSPTILMAPPLATTPTGESYAHREAMTLTPLGIAGKRLFIAECGDCHGRDGRGTDRGPDLHGPIYTTRQMSGRTFHNTVTEGVKSTKWTLGDMPASPDLTFNEIELIGRYVREVRDPNNYR